MRRTDRINDALRRGGAINKSGAAYSLHHPTEARYPLKEEEALSLLNEGALVVVNCGCTGFWWALRPDLMAARSAALAGQQE